MPLIRSVVSPGKEVLSLPENHTAATDVCTPFSATVAVHVELDEQHT